MKLGQVILLIFTSIITFIGLACNKLYEKYVKKNVVVQFAFYCFWTILVLRLLYWIAKPLIKSIIPTLKLCVSNVNITFTADPSISLTIIGFLFLSVMIFVTKSWLNND